ncbi:hypothetical protein ES705_09329 [subsurface metagenome]
MLLMMDIKAVREKLGLTQEGFAQKLGVSWGTIARWEAGKSKPSKLAQRALENFLKEQEIGGER